MAAVVCLVLSSLWLVSGPDGAPPSSNALRTLGAMFTFQGAVVAMLWFFTRKHEISVGDAFGLRQRPGHAALLGMTAAIVFVPAALGMQWLTLKLAALLNLHLPEQSAVALLKMADTWTERAVLGLMAMVAAPLAEEGLFRGVFYPALQRYGFPRFALWGTSLAFALIHGNVLIFVPLVLLAVVLTLLYQRTGNLLASITCHATFNAINFIMLFTVKTSS